VLQGVDAPGVEADRHAALVLLRRADAGSRGERSVSTAWLEAAIARRVRPVAAARIAWLVRPIPTPRLVRAVAATRLARLPLATGAIGSVTLWTVGSAVAAAAAVETHWLKRYADVENCASAG
jgi:hypothetical protein